MSKTSSVFVVTLLMIKFSILPCVELQLKFRVKRTFGEVHEKKSDFTGHSEQAEQQEGRTPTWPSKKVADNLCVVVSRVRGGYSASHSSPASPKQDRYSLVLTAYESKLFACYPMIADGLLQIRSG